MRVPAESLSGSSVRDKVVTAAEAVRLVRDGDSVVVDGFMGQCFAEELTLALEQRFLLTGTPRDLELVFTMAAGNRLGRGLDRLAHKGLLKRAVGGHWALSPELGKMAVDNAIEAHNLPQGVISQLFRDTAAGKPGLLTRVGLGTFVDPRQGGGKINERTTEDRVELITLGGEEYLFYKALQLDVAFLRGTTADPEGNITMEREALTLEALAVATAVHNAGGLVVVQVERVAESGSLSPPEVKIPGIMVDCVVVSQPDHHWQTFGTSYSAALSGELRRVRNPVPPLALTERKVIARRAAMELRPDSAVNLGIGIPEGVANVAAEEHILDYLTLTAEPGAMGGMPAGGWTSARQSMRKPSWISRPSSTSMTGAASTPRSWAWLRRTVWATSISAGSGRSWRARGASSTSARTPSGWCSPGLSSCRAAAGCGMAGWSSPTVSWRPSFSPMSSSAPSAASTRPPPTSRCCT
jgi:propionate CoA-transferase